MSYAPCPTLVGWAEPVSARHLILESCNARHAAGVSRRRKSELLNVSFSDLPSTPHAATASSVFAPHFCPLTMKLAVIISAAVLVAFTSANGFNDVNDQNDLHDDHDDKKGGANSANLPICNVAELSKILTDPNTATCAQNSGYEMTALTVPTPQQITAMCHEAACHNVLQRVEGMAPEECILAQFHLHRDLIGPLDEACDDDRPVNGRTGSTSGKTGMIGTNTTGSNPMTPPSGNPVNPTNPNVARPSAPNVPSPQTSGNTASVEQDSNSPATGPSDLDATPAPLTPSGSITTTSGSVSRNKCASVATVLVGAAATAIVTMFF